MEQSSSLAVSGKRNPQALRFRGSSGLPTRIRRQIEFFPDGRAREPRKIAWLYRFLEIGDAAQSAREVGYSLKSAANIGWNFKQEFAPLILACMPYMGAVDLPLARAVLVKVMQAYDPDARVEVVKEFKDGRVERSSAPDPARAGSANAMAAVKAAEALMDRFGLPKASTVEVKGMGDEPGAGDYKFFLDKMVAGMGGIDVVRRLAWVMERREFREYLEGKYGGLKDVTPRDGGEKMPVAAVEIETGDGV